MESSQEEVVDFQILGMEFVRRGQGFTNFNNAEFAKRSKVFEFRE